MPICDLIPVVMGQPVVIRPEYVLNSSEAMDGSKVEMELWWPEADIPKLWVTSRFLMPSGRRYLVSELRWRFEESGGYRVELTGVPDQ